VLELSLVKTIPWRVILDMTDYKQVLKSINSVALVAEMLGTFGLVFAVLAASKFAAGGAQLVQQNPLVGGLESVPVYFISIPLIAAFTVGLLVMVLGKFSGGHFNPALTFGMWTAKKIRTAPAVAYILVQLLGAFAAFGVMQLFVPEVTALAFSNAEPWKIFAAEALGMFIFAFGVSAAVSQERSTLEAGFMVGASLLLGLIFTGVVVGAGAGLLNPAVFMSTVRESLADLSRGPVFGPLLGAAAGVWMYNILENPKSLNFTAPKGLNLKSLKEKLPNKKK
jgi:glycerol uptake facilitator-like aquaporin